MHWIDSIFPFQLPARIRARELKVYNAFVCPIYCRRTKEHKYCVFIPNDRMVKYFIAYPLKQDKRKYFQ